MAHTCTGRSLGSTGSLLENVSVMCLIYLRDLAIGRPVIIYVCTHMYINRDDRHHNLKRKNRDLESTATWLW